jgi:uncharacterized protein YkwD
LERNVGAVPATALSMLAATLLIATGALPMPASALATSTQRKSASCANANLLPTAADAAAVDAATLCLIDHVRTASHLRPLRFNHELQAVAATQVSAMVRWNYFADNSPSGQTPARLIEATPYAAHATRLATGQNIAWGTGTDATPAFVVDAWMKSPPHRELILTAAYRDAGVSATPAVPSVVESAPGATYAVEFGARRRGRHAPA